MPLPVYVINLNRSPERWAAIQDQARTLGIQLTRFQGIDASASSRENIALAYDFTIMPYRREFRLGEVGCWASHLSLLRHVSKNDAKAIVLEDDAILPDDFIKIMDTLNAISFDGIIKMQGGNPDQRGVILNPLLQRKLVFNPWPKGGAACYFLTQNAATILSQCLQRMDRNVDRILFNQRVTGVKCLEIWPFPVSQNKNFKSLLNPQEKRTKKNAFQRFRREIQRHSIGLKRGYNGTVLLTSHYGLSGFLNLTRIADCKIEKVSPLRQLSPTKGR